MFVNGSRLFYKMSSIKPFLSSTAIFDKYNLFVFFSLSFLQRISFRCGKTYDFGNERYNTVVEKKIKMQNFKIFKNVRLFHARCKFIKLAKTRFFFNLKKSLKKLLIKKRSFMLSPQTQHCQ